MSTVTIHIFFQNEHHSRYSCSIPWNREHIYCSCKFLSRFPMIMYIIMIYYDYQSEDTIHLFSSLISCFHHDNHYLTYMTRNSTNTVKSIVDTHYRQQVLILLRNRSSLESLTMSMPKTSHKCFTSGNSLVVLAYLQSSYLPVDERIILKQILTT